MEDEETGESTPSTAQPTDVDVAVGTPAAPSASAAPAQGVVAVLLFAFLTTLVVRRVGRSNLAGGFRRWMPVLYAGVWGVAVLAVTLIYAQGLPNSWYLATWLLLLVAAFASVGWLRSVVAGVAISIEGRIKLGDAVRVGELAGEVVGFGVRSLRLRAIDGSIHEIPNERLVVEPMTNLSGGGGDSATEVVISLPRGVDPNVALERARRIAILSPLASPRHRPEVFLEPRDGSSYDLRVRGYAFDAAYRDHFRSDVVARLQSAFEEGC